MGGSRTRGADAGSLAFLVSGVLGVVAVTAVVGLVELKSRDWQAEWINMIGCVAFGVSALGAFVTETGVTEDALLANVGTFVGALCFLAAALLILPSHRRDHGCGRHRHRNLSASYPQRRGSRRDSTGTTGIAASGNSAHTANATG